MLDGVFMTAALRILHASRIVLNHIIKLRLDALVRYM